MIFNRLRHLTLAAALALSFIPSTARAAVCELGGADTSAIEELCTVREGMARFMVGGKWGFLGLDGKVAIAPQYDNVINFSEGIASARVGGKWGLIDKQGSWIVTPRFDVAGQFFGGLAVARVGEDWGYLDRSGGWALPPQYADADAFHSNVAVVTNKDDTDSLIDRKGRLIKRFAPGIRLEDSDVAGMFSVHAGALPRMVHLDGRSKLFPAAADVNHFTAQHFIARQKVRRGNALVDQFGLVDLDGKWVVPAGLARFQHFVDKLAIVSPAPKKEGEPMRFGMIDAKGNYVVRPVYDKLARLPNGAVQASKPGSKNRIDYLDVKGKPLFSANCKAFTVEDKGGKWRQVSACGTTWIVHDDAGAVAQPTSAHTVAFSGEQLLVSLPASDDGKRPLAFVFYNAAGKRALGSEAVPDKLDTIELVTSSSPSLPLAYVGRFDGPMVLITRSYEVLERSDWRLGYDRADYTDRYAEGPMVVQAKGGRYGAVDLKGNWVVPASFRQLSPFKYGLAVAQVKDGEALVDAQGKTYGMPKGGRRYEIAAPMMLDLYNADGSVLRYDVRTGVARPAPWSPNVTGDDAAGGLAPATKGEQWGLMDHQGRWAAPARYSDKPEPVRVGETLIGWITKKGKGEAGVQRGWLAADGRELVAPRYSEIELDTSSGTLIVRTEDGLAGVMTPQGKLALPMSHAKLEALGDGWFSSKGRELYGLVDEQGEWKMKPGPEPLQRQARHGVLFPYALGSEDGGVVLVDSKGRRSTQAAPQELAGGEEGSQFWWSSSDGAPGVSATYTDFYGFNYKRRLRIAGDARYGHFSEGVIAFQPHVGKDSGKDAGKTALIDDKGQLIGVYPYEDIGDMRGGLAVATRKGEGDTQNGYLNRSGQLAIPFKFGGASPFSEGRAVVRAGGHLGLIDQSGTLLAQGAWVCGKNAAIVDADKKVLWAARSASGCVH